MSQLNKNILSSFRSKVKLTKKDINLMSILLSVYYHIKNNPPSTIQTRIPGVRRERINYSLRSWDNFVQVNYPFYDEISDDVDRWPKFMFLLFGVYEICYNEFYNLKGVLM